MSLFMYTVVMWCGCTVEKMSILTLERVKSHHVERKISPTRDTICTAEETAVMRDMKGALMLGKHICNYVDKTVEHTKSDLIQDGDDAQKSAAINIHLVLKEDRQ